MFAVVAKYTKKSEVYLWWWGNLETCESNAEDARRCGCKYVRIVEIEDFKPVGTTADDNHVWEQLDAMGPLF